VCSAVVAVICVLMSPCNMKQEGLRPKLLTEMLLVHKQYVDDVNLLGDNANAIKENSRTLLGILA
jgi:hypothetical protein